MRFRHGAGAAKVQIVVKTKIKVKFYTTVIKSLLCENCGVDRSYNVIFSHLCPSPFTRYGLSHLQQKDYGNFPHKSRTSLWLPSNILLTSVKCINFSMTQKLVIS